MVITCPRCNHILKIGNISPTDASGEVTTTITDLGCDNNRDGCTYTLPTATGTDYWVAEVPPSDSNYKEWKASSKRKSEFIKSKMDKYKKGWQR